MLSLFAVALAAAPQLVEVTVSLPQTGDGAVYHYQVTNSSSQPIVALNIGLRDENVSDKQNGEPQLLELPAGYPDAPAIAAPAGWAGIVVTQAEHDRHYIEFRNPAGLAPRATLGGFSVRLAKADPTHIEGWFHALLADSTEYSGPLVLVKIAEPSVTPAEEVRGPAAKGSTSRLILVGGTALAALVVVLLVARARK